MASTTRAVNCEEFCRRMGNDISVKALRSMCGNDLPSQHTSALLSYILLNARNMTNMEELDRLIKLPGIKEKLQTAWKNQSFKEMYEVHKELFPAHQSKPSSGGVYSMQEGQYTKMQQWIVKAWNISYEGAYHKLLFDNIKCMKTMEPYTNICSIIQSSGTGKSRMVDEQAKLVYTLPINIRTKKDTQVAYPPPDEPLYQYLVESTNSAHEQECKASYYMFFKHLFSHASTTLEKLPTQPIGSPAEFANRWYECMREEDFRLSFYQQVVELCYGELSDHRVATLDSLLSDAKANLRSLINKVKSRSKEPFDKIKVVVYIDEAHELGVDVTATDPRKTHLDIMCSVLAQFLDHDLFCLLLSTQSLMQLPASPGNVSVSERAWATAHIPLPPITETPFDCAPNSQVIPGKLRVKDLWTIDYLAQWGRPLWWAMSKASEADQPTKERIIMETARMKLLRRHHIYCEFSEIPLSSPANVAIMDVLLALDYEPTRETTFGLQADLVKSHLRIMYSVPRHRTYFRSGYSSEPVLAEAAAQQIYQFQHTSKKKTLEVMLNLLSAPLRQKLLDVGQRGEVAMRLLLMRAYIDSVLEDAGSPTPPIPHILFSRGCKFVTFIQQLFNSKVSEDILGSRPDNKRGKCGHFRDTFRNSVVRFTHFARAADNYALTTEALFAAFARGMAFICYQTQKSVDIVIPVLYDSNKPLQESSMTAMLVQVKRRLRGRAPTVSHFSHKDIGLFPKPKDDASPGRPYVTFVAELGVQRGGGLVHVSPSTKPTLDEKDTHPRFQITAYGCSNTVYNLGERGFDTLQDLLATRDFLTEHPRKDVASRSAVMRLKPVWEGSQRSFHWISQFDTEIEPEESEWERGSQEGSETEDVVMNDAGEPGE